MKAATAKRPATGTPAAAAPPTAMVGWAEATVALEAALEVAAGALLVAATVAWGWPSVNSLTTAGAAEVGLATEVAATVAWGWPSVKTETAAAEVMGLATLEAATVAIKMLVLDSCSGIHLE